MLDLENGSHLRALRVWSAGSRIKTSECVYSILASWPSLDAEQLNWFVWCWGAGPQSLEGCGCQVSPCGSFRCHTLTAVGKAVWEESVDDIHPLLMPEPVLGARHSTKSFMGIR